MLRRHGHLERSIAPICRTSGPRAERRTRAIDETTVPCGPKGTFRFTNRFMHIRRAPMSNQDFGSDPMRGTRGGPQGKNVGAAASDAMSSVSDMAQQAAEQAKRTAADAASTVTTQVKEMLDRQVGTGADMVGHVAHSAKRAAEDLDETVPQLAGLVRIVADRIDAYADDLRDQSVDQLLQTATDLARRQPALVFGVAALAGFFLFRTIKSAPGISAPSIQPGRGGRRDGGSHDT
jgi:hypothetical protein